MFHTAARRGSTNPIPETVRTEIGPRRAIPLVAEPHGRDHSVQSLAAADLRPAGQDTLVDVGRPRVLASVEGVESVVHVPGAVVVVEFVPGQKVAQVPVVE